MDNMCKWHGIAGGLALRNGVAGCSALPTLLDTAAGGGALAELLEAAKDMKRFMAT